MSTTDLNGNIVITDNLQSEIQGKYRVRRYD
jgi:hypothetical protein